MNSILLKDESGLITDPYILNHIHTTLKLQTGDQVKCIVLNRGHFTGTVKELNQKSCQLSLSEFSAGSAQWFDLIVGLSRPQTSKKILEHATTFGARSFHFFKATLSEKSYLDSKLFEEDAYLEFLYNGLSQASRFSTVPTFKLNKYNPAEQYAQASQKFILDLNADKSFLDYDLNFEEPIILAIGPERGWTVEDIDIFKTNGFRSVKISSSILRVEHAVYSAISQLELLRKRF